MGKDDNEKFSGDVRPEDEFKSSRIIRNKRRLMSDLHSPKYRSRTVPNKKKKGKRSKKNVTKEYLDGILD